jgi:uroporphyrinogen decarboxylase
MNSKERVRAAIAREPLDRIPFGLYAVDHDTISRVIGRPTIVRNQIAMAVAFWEGRHAEVAQQWVADLTDFYRRLDCVDIITCRDAMLMPPPEVRISPLMWVNPRYDRRELPVPKRIADDRWEDRDGRIYQANHEANEIICVYDPLLTSPPTFSVAQFEGPIPAAAPPDPAVFAVLDPIMAAFGAEKYIVSPNGGSLIISLLGGYESGLMLHVDQPEVIHAYNRRQVIVQNQLDAYHIRPGCDASLMDTDIGGTAGPIISPKTYRSLYLPYLTQRIAHIKTLVPQAIIHNCGNTIPLIDLFIAAGFDCYQSLQTTAGMEVGLLKARFGERMAFWGGVPLELLIAGTADEVRAAVRTALERGGPTGFILGPSQSIARNTRYDNFMAMLDEFERLRDRYV